MPDLTKRTKLSRLYGDFYQPLQLRGGSPKTTGLYALVIGHFSRFLNKDAAVEDFSDDTLARYASWRRADGRAVATVNGEIAKLKALWNFACKRGVLKKWPTIEDEPEPKRVPVAWMREELERLFQACRSARGRIGNVPACDYWTALVSVLWDSGERVGAVLQVQWHHLDAPGGWLTVPAEYRKGRVKERVLRLRPETVADVLKLKIPKARSTDKIFAIPYTPSYLWALWADLLESAGLPTDRRSKFHRIRRSFASHLTAAGGNAQDALGHESMATTRLYLDPRITTTTHPTDLLFRPGQN